MIPTFIGYKILGIYDTFFVYLLGGPAINIMGTFLVRQTFDKISTELDEAAKIDGAVSTKNYVSNTVSTAKTNT